MTRRFGTLISLLATLLVSGCGGGGAAPAPADAGPAVDLADPGDLLPEPDLWSPPRLPEPAPMTRGKDAVLSSVQLITITFKDYIYQMDAESFGDWIVTSDYYKQVGADYGVGAGKHIAKVQLPPLLDNQGMPIHGINDSQLQKLIKDNAAKGVLPTPKAGDQFMYMVYFPADIAISQGNGGPALCVQFGGYHGALYVTASPTSLATYSIIGDCNVGLGEITIAASHELIEAASDPWLDNWRIHAAPPDHWTLEGGQENGDMCEYLPGVNIAGYTVTRVWSPTAAVALHEPCIPSDTTDFETVIVTPAQAPPLVAGQTYTYFLTGWSSNARMKPWPIAIDQADNSRFTPKALSARLSSPDIGVGSSVRLTIIVPGDCNDVSPPCSNPGDFGGVNIISGDSATRHVMPVAFQIPMM